VVMAVIATLLTLVVPRYHASVQRAKEAVLKENLYQMRDALGKYHADKGKYPDSLEALAAERYVRTVPVDPITESATTWVPVAAPDAVTPGVWDVRSGAQGKGLNGVEYTAW